MRLIDAYKKLEQLNDAALQTRDAAGVLGIDAAHASKILERLAQAGLVISISKGLWAFPKRMVPLLLPRYCAAPFACYVSLQTALYQHDMIMQVPSVIYAVTLARTKHFLTALGEVSLHHIDPSFFFGYEVDKTGIALATPEKALLDFLYLSGAKSLLFGKLPELELPKKFSRKKANEMIERIPSLQRRTLVQNRFNEILLRNQG
jgi:predicted transcriptional regulator of viral defense system